MLNVIRKVRIAVKYLSIVLTLRIAQTVMIPEIFKQPTIIPQNAGNT